MKVETATNKDINDIVRLLRDYSQDLPIECAEKALSPRKASIIVASSIVLGLTHIVRGAKDSALLGCVIGIVTQNVWSDHVNQIDMLVLYVKQEYRTSSAGGRLMKAYLKSSEELMNSRDDIAGSIVYSQPKGTNMNYEKIGFNPLQIQYLKEK